MKKLIVLFALLLVLTMSGCSTIQWSAIPEQAVADNAYFSVAIRPICTKQGWNTAHGCSAFELTVSNKTATNLEIDWNKTAYIQAGQTHGGLMFDGIVYTARNNPKQPDIVFPNATFKKTVYPNNLVFFTTGQYGGWTNSRMPVGENGVYFVVKVGGKEITERLSTRLTAVEK
jgi:uncharacterized protein YceK